MHDNWIWFKVMAVMLIWIGISCGMYWVVMTCVNSTIDKKISRVGEQSYCLDTYNDYELVPAKCIKYFK